MAVLGQSGLTLAEVSAHLRFLASDELMGRKTGTAGNDVAARYIAEQFRAAGLSELDGAQDHLQRIDFENVIPPKSGSLRVEGATLRQGEEIVILEGPARPVQADAVFAEFGRSQSQYATDDFGDTTITGKIVVAKFGTPEARGQQAVRESRKKRSIAAAKGAVGLIELYSGRIPWDGLSRFLLQPRMQIAAQTKNTPPMFHIILNDSDGKHAAQFRSKNSKVTFENGDFRKTALRSSNVVGMVQGIDPRLRQEHLLLSAHFDHVGASMNLRGATAADSIFNGASDNAMGTVAVMAAAKLLAQNPPARSVIFMATTAEEEGLLGSRYYTENPLVPLPQTVFVLNTDGAGLRDPDVVTVIGLERTTAQNAIERAVQEHKLAATSDPVPQMGLFNLSDNAPFARAGVPAITISPGFKTFDEKIASKLHQPGDEVDASFNFQYLLTFCKAYAQAARSIADMENTPRWITGDPFEKVANKLYGGR
jgi:hypothetical protein